MKNKQAFTLIELLVVVLIIGILAAVALPQYQKAVIKSRYATIKSLVQTLANAEETYYLANGEYTIDVDVLSVDMPPATSCSSTQDKRICTYPWGVCTVKASTTESSYIECILHQNNLNTIGYQQTLKYSKAYPGKAVCFPYNLTNLTQPICQSETGHSTPDYKTGYYYN